MDDQNKPQPNLESTGSKPAPDLKFTVPTTPPPTASSPVQPPIPQSSQQTAPPQTNQPPAIPATPTPPPAGPREFKTTIRSMVDDVSKLKVGQQPSGTNLQKSITVPPPQTVTPKMPEMPIPPPTNVSREPPSTNLPRAELGQTEKTKPLAPSMPPEPSRVPVPPLPPRPQIAPADKIPALVVPVQESQPGSSRTALYLGIALGALIVGAVAWFFFFKSEEAEVVLSPTPTRTALPTATPVPNLSEIFSVSDSGIVWGIGSTVENFVSDVNKVPISGGEFKAISSTKGQEGGLSEFLSSWGISYPAVLNSTLGSDHLFLIFGQQEAFNSKGVIIPNNPVQRRLAFIAEAKDSATLIQTLSTWEVQMTDALTPFFGLNRRPASTGFLDNNYLNTPIRYLNFPYPDSTIDYGIVTSRNGKQYLVITNSRESFFQVTTRLK